MICPAVRCSSASQPRRARVFLRPRSRRPAAPPSRTGAPAPSASRTSSNGRTTSLPRRSTAQFPLCPTAWRTSISTPGATFASNPISRCFGQEGANFRLELFHLGHLYKRPVVVNVLRDGIPGHPLRHESLRLWPHQGRRRPADQSRLRRLSAALSAQRPARVRRGDRVSWRELFPLSWPRPALRSLRSGPGDQRRSRPQRAVPVLSRILDRDAGRGGGARRHLCAA